MKNIGVQHEIIPIAPLFKQYLETETLTLIICLSNVAEENIQARIRGVLLMAMSNKFGYILLNTLTKVK